MFIGVEGCKIFVNILFSWHLLYLLSDFKSLFCTTLFVIALVIILLVHLK